MSTTPNCQTARGNENHPRNEVVNQSYVEKPAQTGVGMWCSPGPAVQQKRRWLLRFEDQDRGDCVYVDEAEARRRFAMAEALGWNCHLFEHASRASPPPATPAGEMLREESEMFRWLCTKASHKQATTILNDSPQGIRASIRAAMRISGITATSPQDATP